ncbi:MAG: DUF1501 domain-containing protein [Planctomycetota bacterium]
MSNRLCNPATHLSRRTLLGAGTGSMLMPMLAQQLARAAESSPGGRPKSVIQVWLEGGPSQLETFDPHAGTKIGGDVKAIDTSIPGVQISDLLPQTAEQMHLASLVRSVVGKEGDHERASYNVKTGFRPDPTLIHPSLGAVLCSADSRGAEIPRHVSILPGNWPARGGYLGASLDAFKIGDPAQPVPDISARVDSPRYDQRVKDLNKLERRFATGRLINLEKSRTLHASATEAAMKMMSSEQVDAFDVTQESASERDPFGDTSFGRGCLAAIRLIEVGVRCVEVTLGGWDSHAANHTLQAGKCETLDPALASLLRVLKERDLLDSTLVVCGGEFGRTPTHNPADGRDHWPHGFSVLLSGCGIRAGHVHGATSPELIKPPVAPQDAVEDPVTIADLHATMMHVLGIDHEHEEDTPIGRPMKRSEGQVIKPIVA